RGLVGFVRPADVRQGDVRAVARQALDDGGPDAAAAAGNERPLVLQWRTHAVPLKSGERKSPYLADDVAGLRQSSPCLRSYAGTYRTDIPPWEEYRIRHFWRPAQCREWWLR